MSFSSYKQLEKKFKKLYQINSVISFLRWDAATYMPLNSSKVRSGQLTVLEGITHKILDSKSIKKLLDETESRITELNDWQKANLKEMRRLQDQATSIPSKLKTKLIKASLKAERFWRQAKAEKDFKIFAPHLQELIYLLREKAQYRAARYNVSPYDALLMEYDHFITSKEIDKVVVELEKFSPNFINATIENQRAKKLLSIEGHFPVYKQKQFIHEVLKRMGFSFDQGRIDETEHAFCGGVQGDIRIAVRYDESKIFSALMDAIHELGHATYDHQLPKEWVSQPVGQDAGMSLHESQSLLFEMQVARTREFFEFIAPLLRNIFNLSGPAWQAENLYYHASKVQKSFIRTSADEGTYPGHLILRYNLEKQLLSNELQVKELPEAWNACMEKQFGIKPVDDADGCLQDIHWALALFGYFPTYILGAVMAAQFYEAALKNNPTIPSQICMGNFTGIVTWLDKNVHQYGSRYSSREILQRATGDSFNVETYKKNLMSRYC